MDNLEATTQKGYRELTITDNTIRSYVKRFPPLAQIISSDGLPHRFVPASDDYFNDQLFYWDSLPILKALAHQGREGHATMLGTVENFFFELDKHGHVPNSQLWTSRTQPPFLSSMVLMVYDTFIKNGYWNEVQAKTWLQRAYDKVKTEYETVWAGPASPGLVQEFGLSKYFDRQNGELYGSGKPYYGPQQASGWDNSTRYDGVAHELMPVDLNSFLFKYEHDLEKMAGLLNDPQDQELWALRKQNRRKIMNRLMWNGEGFSDYNLRTGQQVNPDTLAGYSALWAGLLDPAQDKAKVDVMVGSLGKFEHDFGLAATTPDMAGKGYQWAYPNVWPILNLIAIEGARKYKHDDVADRISYGFLTGLAYVSQHPSMGQFPETFSAVDGKPRAIDPRYNHQPNTYMTWGAASSLHHDMQDAH
jgi:alpha,alpha-trehalase